MQTFVLIVILIAALAGLALITTRQMDLRADRAEHARLVALRPPAPARFSTDMVRDLPDPARRFFTFAIAEGTPLWTVARFQMRGSLALGTKDAPGAREMTATQVLAAPEGFLWQMSTTESVPGISGSDSNRWTRFWLAGLIPVARTGGTQDHKRSAFGRYISEALIWTPAALLPSPSVSWQAVDDSTARVTVTKGPLTQSVDLTVGPDGAPQRVLLQRWSDANPERVFRLQPFGAELSDYRSFAGIRLPTHVEAGNFAGTPAYFPFFIADLTSVDWLDGQPPHPVPND